MAVTPSALSVCAGKTAGLSVAAVDCRDGGARTGPVAKPSHHSRGASQVAEVGLGYRYGPCSYLAPWVCPVALVIPAASRARTRSAVLSMPTPVVPLGDEARAAAWGRAGQGHFPLGPMSPVLTVCPKSRFFRLPVASGAPRVEGRAAPLHSW